MNRDEEGVFLLSHVYDDLLLSAAATRYGRKLRRTGPIQLQDNLTRKQNYNSKTVGDLALVPIET